MMTMAVCLAPRSLSLMVFEGIHVAMSNSQQSELYWRGGPFQVSIISPPDASQASVSQALKVLKGFRDACQKQYAAFCGAVNGRLLAYERFRQVIEPANGDKSFFIGTGPPDSEQLPGQSTIVQMSQKDFLESLKQGGAFEQQHAKAFAVFIYTLWEENYRQRIANAMSVSKDSVNCALMGDIRHVRNVIIHDNSVVSQDFPGKLKLLSQIWDLKPGELRITEKMLHSCMEQLNAIRIQITSGR